METNELLTILEEAGFSPYQASAYATLLELGSASASEIATASDVPQPRIYDILRDLENDGYVTTYDRDRLYAQVNDPSDALSGLRTTINQYENAISEIKTRYQTPDVQDGDVNLVRGVRTVLEHAQETIEAATDHIQFAATPDQFRRLRTELRNAHKRDVHVQLSLHVSPDEELPFDSSDFEGVCTEVRRRDLPGPFLLLADRQQACYATHNQLSSEYGVLVDDYTLAYVFHWYYLTRLWEVYESIFDGRSDRPPYTFVEITECIRGIEPALNDGAIITGRIEGEFVRTGRECMLSGRFGGVEYTGSRPDETSASLLELAAEARIRFETADGSYTIGGRGALTEDVAAKRFTIKRIDESSVDILPS
ncbi:TrmB family transcriptional regulator [Haladaptatus caseinilyticus]|uniref:TrmB family transcriptional regulator n=1 Tax=Haladaptatus caseinilyticus TaxID=2993314 RepID=UPI00224AFE15|nr:TrmB family transcriptional regulator [Haladaptatus caseinilyticus]